MCRLALVTWGLGAIRALAFAGINSIPWDLMNEITKDPRNLWENGYTIGELWKKSAPVSRGGPQLETSHLIMWGILSIVDDQVGEGAGHKYCESVCGIRIGSPSAFSTGNLLSRHRSRTLNLAASHRRLATVP
jgi:hypothetical protein